MPALENAKRERFCQELLVDDNATQAYIRAGYSENGASQSAERLLRNAEVAARVVELRAERAGRVGITQDDVLRRLVELGFSNMGDYVTVIESGEPVHDFSKMDRKKWGAVQELTVARYTEGSGEDAKEVKRVKFKLYDPRGPVVDVGKHLGMWPNKAIDKLAEGLAELIARTPEKGE